MKKWNEYLWIFSAVYLVSGFFNILFAWIGMICFVTPLLLSILGKGKIYCNSYCGRGQLFELLGGRLNLSSNRNIPAFIRSKWFRYGFLAFFMTMFGIMVFSTYLVYNGTNNLKEVVTLLWTVKLPLELEQTPVSITLDSPICFWILQCYAYVYNFGTFNNVFLQTPLMVCLLSHGYNDSRDKHAKVQKDGESKWSSKQKK